MNLDFEEAEIGEEFAQQGYMYVKISETRAALILDDNGNPVEEDGDQMVIVS